VDLGEEIRLPLRDDGQEGDISARDGTWTGRIPPQRDGSLVWLRFEASTEDGAKSEWPRRGNPATVTGYYVEDDVPEQNEDLQLYYIFTPGALRDLSCADNAYVQGVLVDPTGRARTGVGVKFRGETACGYPKKPIRVEFQKGDLLHGQRHLNFNAGWNDKSMLREQFAFDFFRDAGCPYSETHLARVHTNNGRSTVLTSRWRTPPRSTCSAIGWKARGAFSSAARRCSTARPRATSRGRTNPRPTCRASGSSRRS
jgi:hypothetical protein